MRFFVPAVFVLVCLAPTTSAESGWSLGTEELPELWGSGQVDYSGVPPASGHDYLAINRSWFDVGPTGETVTLHLRVLSTENLETNRANYWVRCDMVADLAIDGAATGKAIRWTFLLTSQDQTHGAYVVDSGETRVNVNDQGNTQPITTEFEIASGEPGYYAWTASRHTLLSHGTNLMELSGRCQEQFVVADVSFNPFPNEGALETSKSDYSLKDGRRVAGPDGNPDDIPTLARNLTPSSPSDAVSESSTSVDKTPGPGLLGAAVAFVLAVALRRRK